ncbi:Clp protease N-terminal domain-containing protein [Streptomyces sp. L7]|uniref:Clp protease N-terminal domain-containing protein n=1 Tax=Streptomyces sp. L7 TaxID=3423954 RepID=UPI003D992C9F
MPENFTPENGSENSFDEFLSRYLAGERARAARSIDISRFLSRRTQELLAEAGRYALEHGHRELDALHILRVMAAQEPASEAMRRIGVDPSAVAAAAEQRLPAPGEPIDADGASITASAQRVLFHAYQVARASGATYIDPEHLFFALVIGQDAPAGQVLQAAGVTPDSLTNAMRQSATVGAGGQDAPRRPATPRPRCSTSSAPT